jgi:hypothetical protein
MSPALQRPCRGNAAEAARSDARGPVVAVRPVARHLIGGPACMTAGATRALQVSGGCRCPVEHAAERTVHRAAPPVIRTPASRRRDGREAPGLHQQRRENQAPISQAHRRHRGRPGVACPPTTPRRCPAGAGSVRRAEFGDADTSHATGSRPLVTLTLEPAPTPDRTSVCGAHHSPLVPGIPI